MRVLFVLISLLSFNLISEENEMMPLDKWVEKSGNLGSAEMLYLSYRCFSLYGMMDSLTADVNNEQQADLSDAEDALFGQAVLERCSRGDP